MTLEELGEKLSQLDHTRQLAEAELSAVSAHRKRVSEFEADRDALLEQMASAVPEGLYHTSAGRSATGSIACSGWKSRPHRRAST